MLKLVCVLLFSDLFSLSSHNTILDGFTLLYIQKMKKLNAKYYEWKKHGELNVRMKCGPQINSKIDLSK